MHRNIFPSLALLALFILPPATRAEDEPIFSGPQKGEKLPALKINGALDTKDLDLIAEADGKPVCVIFVHGVTRPSIGLTRAVMNFASPLSKKKGLVSGLVFLSDDATAMEARVKRMSGALPKGVSIGISPDGQEGPGAYGLNRKVTLTVLVGKEGKATANFAIVDPSLAADLKKITAAIAEAAGVEPPNQKQLLALSGGRGTDQQDPMIRTLIRPVINKEATDEEVDAAVDKLIAYIEKNRAAQRSVGQIARRIVDGGVLKNYGTARAQEHIRKWAEKYGKPQPRGSAKGKEKKGEDRAAAKRQRAGS